MSTTRPTWMLPPLEDLTEFPVDDVARHLGNLCRYAGGTPGHYSVARHSLLVMHLLPAEVPVLRLLGLIHDVHECWIGDMLRPVKARLRHEITTLEREYDERIRKLIGLPEYTPAAYLTAVEKADTRACELEMSWLGKEDGWQYFDAGFDCAKTLNAVATPLSDAHEWKFTFANLCWKALGGQNRS